MSVRQNCAMPVQSVQTHKAAMCVSVLWECLVMDITVLVSIAVTDINECKKELCHPSAICQTHKAALYVNVLQLYLMMDIIDTGEHCCFIECIADLQNEKS